MPEDAASDALLPALFDRLTDNARSITVFDIRLDKRALEGAGVSLVAVSGAIRTIGLRELPSSDREASELAEAHRLRYAAPGRTLSVMEVRQTRVPTPADARGIELQRLGDISAELQPNSQISFERRGVTMRRLRECVLRDLAALLNAICLGASVDLEAYPRVSRSVLNFGLPNLAGKLRTDVTAERLAEWIQRAIETFEPRLSGVRVRKEGNAGEGGISEALMFRIEAELWGEPLPQLMLMRTQIDPGSGEARLNDLGGR